MLNPESNGTNLWADLAVQARCAWVIAKKNARVYYLKGPVVTFGIVFPLFFYLSFAAGHKAPIGGIKESCLLF